MLFLLLISVVTGCKENSNRKEQVAENEWKELAAELEREQERNDSLVLLLQKCSLATEFPVLFPKSFDTIADPEGFIIDALRSRKDLIPKDPVLGGTMQFRQIDVITEDWVLATYEDGHIQGKSIYQYRLLPGGTLRFERVVSTGEN